MNDAPVPFCSEACRDAEAGDEIVREHGYKRFPTGVALDALVPRGIPSDAFVVLAGDEGARRSELATELVRRALTRGEPAVIVAFNDPPIAVLERFFTPSGDVLPFLEMGQLRIVDRFTHRLEDRDAFRSTRNDWSQFVGGVADDAVVAVRDPSGFREVTSALERAFDDLEIASRRPRDGFEMTETGVAVLDSIDDEHVFGGIVDLRLADHVVLETRLTPLGIRKLIGAKFVPR